MKLILALLLCTLAGSLAADDVFLQQHCADCHDADEKKGGLDLTALKADFANADNFAKWVKVLDRVESGEMPPKKKARPPAAESAAFLGSLTKELTDAEGRAIKAGGGRTPVRRMNRAEYENALRDLLALPLLRVKELLPEDGQQFGFDKVAGALDISHVQMTKYLQAADAALRQAVVRAAARPETKTWREPAARQDTMRAALATAVWHPAARDQLGWSRPRVSRAKPSRGKFFKSFPHDVGSHGRAGFGKTRRLDGQAERGRLRA